MTPQGWVLTVAVILGTYTGSLLVIFFFSDMAERSCMKLFGKRLEGPIEQPWHHLVVLPLMPIFAVAELLVIVLALPMTLTAASS